MYCESEGRCHGIALVYFNDEQKERILKYAGKFAKRYRVEPEITIRELENRGEIFIDFYDIYHHEDQCYYEDLVKALDAKLCDCQNM